MIPDRLPAFFLALFYLGSFSLTGGTLPAAEGRKLDLKADQAYKHVIEPILANNCTGCHGADKAKGKIRLHAPGEITKSKSIVADSEGDIPMVFRINLPDNDEDVMPPEDKPRLSAEQKKLIGWWIAQGASFDKIHRLRLAFSLVTSSWTRNNTRTETAANLRNRLGG